MLIQLSELVEQGEYDAMLAQTYLNNEQWQLAITFADKAIGKADKINHEESTKKISYLGNMYLAKGMAHFNLKRFEQSLNAFANAEEQVKTKKTAQQWVKYVAREQENYRQEQQVRLAMLN